MGQTPLQPICRLRGGGRPTSAKHQLAEHGLECLWRHPLPGSAAGEGNYTDIKSSWLATAPGGEEDISRPRQRVSNEVGHLLEGSQGSRLGSAEDNITNGIVVGHPVPTSRPDGHQKGQLCCDIQGRSRRSCEEALQASSIGSNKTPGLEGADPVWQKECH